MLMNNLVVLLLNIYLVICAPAEKRDYLPIAGGSNDQIAQDSNISGVSVRNKAEVMRHSGSILIIIQSIALLKPVIHREDARLEEEGRPSKVLSVYDNSQLKVGDFLNVNSVEFRLNVSETALKIFFLLCSRNRLSTQFRSMKSMVIRVTNSIQLVVP